MGQAADHGFGTQSTGAPRALAAWLHVSCFIAAMVAGALAYRDHFISDRFPWWRSPLELVVGCALLSVAFRDAPLVVETAARRRLRWAAGAVTLMAIAVAVHYGPQPGRELLAGGATVLALGAFAMARWVPFAADDVHHLVGDSADPAPPRSSLLLRRVFTVASVVVAVAASYLNGRDHLAGFVLWLTSLALFVVAMWDRRAEYFRDSQSPWAAEGGPALTRKTELVALLLVLLLAGVLRMILLADFPALVDADEGQQGYQAQEIWKDGFPDAFGLGWNAFPHLSFMTEYVWIQVLGSSNAHLRLSSATVGVLSLIPAFFWVRRWWGNIIALFAVLIMATNHEHIFWSRIGLNNIHQALVAGLILAAFARVLRMGRRLDWVWLGYAIGVGFHTYHAAKLFPALLAGAALLFALGIRGFVRRSASGALVGALAFLLFLGPQIVTIYQQWGYFYPNVSNRSDLHEMTGAYRQGDMGKVREYLWTHVGGCLAAFISIPYKQAIFDPFTCVPFFLGIGWMLWRWRDPRHLVVLIWILGILVIGGMITTYPPSKPRLLGFLPAICLIPAIVAGKGRAWLFRALPAYADVIAVPLLVAWLGASLYANWQTEFVYRPWLMKGDPMTAVCRVMEKTPLPATIYMIGAEGIVDPKVAGPGCMIPADPNRVLIDLPAAPAIVPLPPTHRGTAAFIVPYSERALLPLIRHYYPEAHYDVRHDIYDTAFMHSFTLRPDEIERTRGLEVTFRSPSRTWRLPGASNLLDAAEQTEFPIAASGRGQVWIMPSGRYAFRGAGAAVRIDEHEVNSSALDLAAGWHTVEISGTLRKSTDHFPLEWQRPDAPEWAPIARNFLYSHPQTHGLLGRYFTRVIAAATATPISEAPDYSQIDAAISFDWLFEVDARPPPAFAARPSTMEWIGSIELPEGKSHGMRLEASTPVQVFVNGTQVLSTPGGREALPVEATLSGVSGSVPILIRTTRAADDFYGEWKLRLFWRGPGDEWTAFVKYQPPGMALERAD